jgi:hypothetical protein
VQARTGRNFKSLHRQKPGGQARIHAGRPDRAAQEHCPMPITDKYAIVLQYLSTYHHLCDKGQWSCYLFAGNGPLKRLLVRGRWVAFECWVFEYILYSPENLMQWGISLSNTSTGGGFAAPMLARDLARWLLWRMGAYSPQRPPLALPAPTSLACPHGEE